LAARDYLYNTHTHTHFRFRCILHTYVEVLARIDNIITYARSDRRHVFILQSDHRIIIIYYRIYVYDDDASRPDNIIITCGIVYTWKAITHEEYVYFKEFYLLPEHTEKFVLWNLFFDYNTHPLPSTLSQIFS